MRAAPATSKRTRTASRSRQSFPDLRDRPHGEPYPFRVDRQRLRRELGDDKLVLAVDEEVLPIAAQAEYQRRGAMQHIPLAAVMDRHAGKVWNEAARIPGLAVAVSLNVLDPGRRVLDHPLPEAREVARRGAHAACAARSTEAVNRDVGAALGTHRLPEELAHQVGKAPARGTLDHPPEQVGVWGDVMKPPAVRPVALVQQL